MENLLTNSPNDFGKCRKNNGIELILCENYGSKYHLLFFNDLSSSDNFNLLVIMMNKE